MLREAVDNQPTRDSRTGLFTSPQAPGSPADAALQALFNQVKAGLIAERPGAAQAVLIQIHELAVTVVRLQQIDREVERRGGPIAPNGRIRSAFRERQRVASHLVRLLELLPAAGATK